jgi:hypothetical protein
MRMITIQREQYGTTVHLFIGTVHDPDKITFMSLTFTHNHDMKHYGLNSLFPFRPASSSVFVTIISRSYCSLAIASAFVFTIFRSHLHPVCLHYREELPFQRQSSLQQPISCWKPMVNHVFEDLRNREALNRRMVRLINRLFTSTNPSKDYKA